MRTKARALLGTAAATAGIAATMLVGPTTAHATTSQGHTAVQAQAAGTVYGCPYGAVCIYADDDPNHRDAAHITNTYWSYGPHNLRNQYDYHTVLNNQYGGATATLCDGYNGTNCSGINRTLPPFERCNCMFLGAYLTPINSITLNRP